MKVLQDSHGRVFRYLRLSLTDSCNFRCQYCLPNGYQHRPKVGNLFEDSVLRIDEIENLVAGFSELGFSKIRLTGGEPTLRPDIIEIVRRVSGVPGIKTVALTTNGYRLDKIADPLRDAGLDAINISMDSLDSDRFEQITGSRNFDRIYHGVLEALRAGIGRVKINVVLLKSFIDKDLPALLDFAHDHEVTVRFIELMQTSGNGEFFAKEHVAGDEFRARLEAQGWNELERSDIDGPAHEFAQVGFAGRLGIISPYSKDFCTNCNRLRISSRGKIKLCLFGDGELPLRHLLQSHEQRAELTEAVSVLIGDKAPSHLLHQGIFGSTQNLSGIGG